MTEPRDPIDPTSRATASRRSLDGILPWSWAVERLERAIVYWLATTGADAAPHVIPIWGAWVDGRWYVEGGPTRWQRNLRENPQLAIHIEIGDEVVIVEGAATELVAPADAPGRPDPGGLREVQGGRGLRGERRPLDRRAASGSCSPVKAFAWSVFPADMTRFRFEVAAGTLLRPLDALVR